MNQTLILFCTLAALAGLPLGYGIGWCWDRLDELAESYIDGIDIFTWAAAPEVWR